MSNLPQWITKLNRSLASERGETQLPTTTQSDIDQSRSVNESTDEDGNTYPEGGLRAWLVAFGSFTAMFAGFGILNTIGIFQAYISANQLKDYDESIVSWIFSIFAFLTFFCGLQIGPIFDARGPRIMIALGSAALVVSIMLLGECTKYWHFVLDFSILGGIGASLLFTPAVSSVSHYFLRRRALATGLATTGGSMGGIVFPLMLQALIPKLGWAWSTRILGFIILLLCLIAIMLVRSRLPPRKGSATTWRDMLPDFRIFIDGTGALALTTAGTFLLEWGLFVPVAYLTSYALANHIDPTFSYQLIAVFNVGSVFGRWLPGYVADRMGRYNTQICALIMCLITSLALWLPAGSNLGLVISFAVLFGFASGSNISLTPICVGQLCGTQDYGRYYATVYTVVSFGTLTGIPIAGALVTATGGAYYGLILFSGLSYAMSLVCFLAVRVMRCGWGLKVVW